MFPVQAPEPNTALQAAAGVAVDTKPGKFPWFLYSGQTTGIASSRLHSKTGPSLYIAHHGQQPFDIWLFEDLMHTSAMQRETCASLPC